MPLCCSYFIRVGELVLMASKIQVAKFHDFSEGPILDHTSTGVWNMEENDVVGQLNDESFKKRVEILEQLIITVKRNGGRLPYSDHESIFRGLSLALSDSNWEIRHKCIVLLQELIPSLQDDLDHSMSLVLSKLISNIGDSKVTLRKAVISNLHRYMKHTKNMPALLHAIVNTGLENEDVRVRRETISALPMLLTREFTSCNLYGVIQSLAKKLLDTAAEDNLKDISLTTMQYIEKLLGTEQFDIYVQKLSPSLRKYYLQLTGKLDSCFSNENSNHFGMFSASNAQQTGLGSGIERHGMHVDSFEFGIIPMHIMVYFNDQKDFKTRAQAVEDLKRVILELSSHEINQKLTPHMVPFMNFISTLLDDSNFKIITVALEIMHTVVERLGGNVKNYVKTIFVALSKRMGDNKVVIRQSIMRIVMKMMQCHTPQLVLNALFDNLTHRNSRVRQETINFIIAALLTFPSYEFDLPNICMVVGPTLTDVKRQVRQAALECFAVLAQAMGSGRLQPLVQAVDQVELSSEGEGLMAAVQARLARRQLPRLNSEGLVEYATPIPSSAAPRSSNQSADTEWIIGSVGVGSARSARSDFMEMESVSSSSARSTPAMSDFISSTPAPRRFMSAGRGRHKLPWEDDGDDRSRAYEDMPNSAPAHGIGDEIAPPKPRAMWLGEGDGGSPDFRTGPKRKTALDSLGLRFDDNDSADTKDNGHVRSDQRILRTGLDPISIDGTTPVSIKTRGPSQKNGAKITAIPHSAEHTASLGDDDKDSAFSTTGDSSDNRQNGQLRGIRNSAKNKVQRMFNKAERQESQRRLASPTRSEQVEESGIFSIGTQATILSNRSKRTEAGNGEPKLKIASHGSVAHKRNNESLDINENKPAFHFDYNPNSGVTFRENRTSDVQVVGRGYNDDSTSIYDVRSTQANTRNRDRRRVNRGMFDSSTNLPEYPVTSTGVTEKGERKSLDKFRGAAPQGVVGIGVSVRSTGDMSNVEIDSTAEDDSEDETASLTKSMSFKRSVADKQRRKKEQEERAKLERELENEQRQHEKEEKIRQERVRLKKLGSKENFIVESLAKPGSDVSNTSSINNVKPSPPRPAAPVVTPRKSIKMVNEPVSSHPMPAMERPSDMELPIEEWKPFSDPDASLRTAQKKLENDDWEMKTDGLNMIRRLVNFHPETFSPVILHPVILAVVNEVKNLRSQVSRLAIVCLRDMFNILKKGMDTDLDIVTRQLLAKAGESNNFIRDDVDEALSAMVEGVTPQRSLLALIAGGASHKNPAVRKTTAQFLVTVVDRMGSGKILSGVKDITDRVLPTAAQFVMDGSPETRYYGRKILFLLMTHPDFDRTLAKYLPANTLRNIQDVVENLKSKGLGDKPSETSSARSRRSGQGSRLGSSLRGGSASSNADGGNNATTPPVRRRPARTNEATMDEIKNMINQLSSGEWRIRHDAISTFLEMCIEHPGAISSNIVKIFDSFLPRLQDSNSKVNLHALKVMHQVVPLLKDSLQSVISMAVTAVVPNLSSKNLEIKATAADILNSFMEHLDQCMLIQPFANQALNAAGHSKSEMVVKVAYLTDRVYSRKPKQVVLHVLPLLWHLLSLPGVGGGAGSGDLRSATAALVETLHQHMGQGLLDKASSDPNMTARHVNILNELL